MTRTPTALLTEQELRSSGMQFFSGFDAANREKCVSVAVRLKQQFSSIPWHAPKAAADPPPTGSSFRPADPTGRTRRRNRTPKQKPLSRVPVRVQFPERAGTEAIPKFNPRHGPWRVAPARRAFRAAIARLACEAEASARLARGAGGTR